MCGNNHVSAPRVQQFRFPSYTLLLASFFFFFVDFVDCCSIWPMPCVFCLSSWRYRSEVESSSVSIFIRRCVCVCVRVWCAYAMIASESVVWPYCCFSQRYVEHKYVFVNIYIYVGTLTSPKHTKLIRVIPFSCCGVCWWTVRSRWWVWCARLCGAAPLRNDCCEFPSNVCIERGFRSF